MKGVKRSLDLARMRFFFFDAKDDPADDAQDEPRRRRLPAMTGRGRASGVNLQAQAPALPARARQTQKGTTSSIMLVAVRAWSWPRVLTELLATFGEDRFWIVGEGAR